jgi:hypothetical protein
MLRHGFNASGIAGQKTIFSDIRGTKLGMIKTHNHHLFKDEIRTGNSVLFKYNGEMVSFVSHEMLCMGMT